MNTGLAEIPLDRAAIPKNTAVTAAEADGEALLPFHRIFFVNDVLAATIAGADGTFGEYFMLVANHELLPMSITGDRQQESIAAIAVERQESRLHGEPMKRWHNVTRRPTEFKP